jgi:glucose/arabinose dehydrogenase
MVDSVIPIRRLLTRAGYGVALLVMASGLIGCLPEPGPAPEVQIEQIRLPEGYSISVFADSVENARSMDLSPSGTLFVGTRRAGNVYALRDADGDGVADERHVVAEGLQMPNGVAYRDGSLFVAEVSRILRYDDIENRLANPPEPVVVVDDFPSDRHHGWKYIAFGPDDKLYVPVGAPCNVCDRGEPYAAIHRMNADGSDREIFATGVRNTVGFTWHPETGEMWFTDNGRDNMGDDIPPCELNHAPAAGMDFGFPHVHGTDILDPEFGEGTSPFNVTAPIQELGPHVAPLGLEFMQENGQTRTDRILIAEHGSWNRSEKIGYRVTMVSLDAAGQALSYEPFAEGWLQGEEAWGRPVDLEYLPDGSLLVSDDAGNRIYRISRDD